MADQLRCDRTAVGVVARDSEGRVLLINKLERPFGWGCPSGHCDGKSYASAAFRHFEEATDLRIVGMPRSVVLKRPIKDNLCEKENGEWHEWMIFEVDWTGELKSNQNIKWFTVQELAKLADRTARYMCAAYDNLETRADVTEIIEDEWRANPGLEPVWHEFLKELSII